MSIALIVELDPLFLGGFALPAELLSERLEKYGILDTDPYRFVRKLYGKPFTKSLAGLLPETIDVAHVERRLAATYTALLQQNAQTVAEQLRPIFKPLAKQGVRFAVVTRLRPAIVNELFEGIADDVTTIFDPLPLAIGLQPETLQSALVALGLPIRYCLGLFACGASVRASVRIGLRAVAVPDPMVAFENCAGASFVADQMTKTFITKLQAALLAKKN
jgi:beta-phosphoglucomutase-like phosphatase (HAD superfamily)